MAEVNGLRRYQILPPNGHSSADTRRGARPRALLVVVIDPKLSTVQASGGGDRDRRRGPWGDDVVRPIADLQVAVEAVLAALDRLRARREGSGPRADERDCRAIVL